MPLILVADDDPNLRYSFRRMLDGRGFDLIEATNGREAVERVEENAPDVVVMDVRMPEMDGLTAFEEIKRTAPDTPVIIMTAYSTTNTAIEAMKRGAFDYILKPFDVDEMVSLISRAARQAKQAFDRADAELGSDADAGTSLGLVGSSRAMQTVYKAIGQVAGSDVHVLILGESGTGKELVARAIHQHSPRASRPFLAINCAAIPDALIESELFGHERGAFTGAATRKAGLLQECDGGTAFLDEIVELPTASQAKLLRFLQEGEIIPLGATAPTRLDVRVITATNRDLKEAIRGDRFREDLYYRLDTVAIRIPALRDRLEDLRELVAHFLHRFNREFGKGFSHIDGRTIEALSLRPWPGNVRELENTIRKASLVGHGNVLLPEHLTPANFPDTPTDPASISGGLDRPIERLLEQVFLGGTGTPVPPLMPTVERLLIAKVLARVRGNQVKAARLLGISRNTLRNRISRYGLGDA